jgi:hypothetical protein
MREAFFLDGQAGRLFCTGVRHPNESRRPAALICPPFAEEMNKALHVAAVVSGLDAADHTFSRGVWRDQVAEWSRDWMLAHFGRRS